MFARVFKSSVVVSVVTLLAVAKGVPTSPTTSYCDNDGQLQCCNQMANPTTNQALGGLLGLLGLGSILGNVGLNCVPITVLGVGNGANCEQQAVCCTDVMQSGLINLGCNPINLNL